MGEKSLPLLLASLEPVQNEGEFVYVSLKPKHPAVTRLLSKIGTNDLVAVVTESEGITFILRRELAEGDSFALGYDYDLGGFIATWITLRVHSSLNAVGLTAAVAGALTQAGISCNIVAAFYHDHLFVPVEDGPKAMEVLKNLSQSESSAD